MSYVLSGPWENETWGAGKPWPDKYSRLAQLQLEGGTNTGPIPYAQTDIARGVTLIVNGTNVEATRYPYQDDLSDASYYFLGGHTYTISDTQAEVLTNAGYGAYLTLVEE